MLFDMLYMTPKILSYELSTYRVSRPGSIIIMTVCPGILLSIYFTMKFRDNSLMNRIAINSYCIQSLYNLAVRIGIANALESTFCSIATVEFHLKLVCIVF